MVVCVVGVAFVAAIDDVDGVLLVDESDERSGGDGVIISVFLELVLLLTGDELLRPLLLILVSLKLGTRAFCCGLC